MTVPLVEVSRGGRRLYSVDLQAEVRSLYDDGDGYSLRAIRRLLISRGVSPAPAVNTLLSWVNPRVAEQDRRRTRQISRDRRRLSRVGGLSGPPRTVDWRMERIVALAGAGLSCAAVAKVMALDCPHAAVITDRQVDSVLRNGATPRQWKSEEHA